MAGLFDKIGKAAQQAAAGAQQTAMEGRIRLEIRNLGGKLDDRAQALGHLMFRQHRGEAIPDEEYTTILEEMTRIESERQAKEVELEDLRQPGASAPANAPAPGAGASFCSGCGTNLVAGAKFCPSCGKPTGA